MHMTSHLAVLNAHVTALFSQAYRDVEGILASLAKLLGKKRQHLRIWDPYVRESSV